MKCILLNLFLSLLAIAATAQNESIDVIPKGTKFIGGNLFFYYDENKYKSNTGDILYKYMGVSAGPVAGKYIMDNLAFGLVTSYSYNNTIVEYYDDTETKNPIHSLGVTSFLRKNYKIVPSLYFFLQAQAGLTYGTSKTTNTSDSETKYNNYSFSLGGQPGLQLFLNKKLSLETSLGYVGYRFARSKTVDTDNRINTHSLDFGGGLGSINFSIRYFIFP